MKRLLCLLLVLCLLASIAPLALAADVPTQPQAYHAMIALQEKYPEGADWTNDDFYEWNGDSSQNQVYFTGGYGCVGFAFMLSDAAFGNLPARYLDEISIEHLRVGDILRVKDDSHSVIILEVHEDHVILAEGNYMGTVHWGRKMTAEQITEADYALTRYPEDYKPALTGWRKAYYDMIQEGIAKDRDSDSLGWELANYALADLNGDAYPELWMDFGIYASGCALATVSEKGLAYTHMQYGALSYLEGENSFVHSGGIQGCFFDTVYAIENGVLVSKAGGSQDVNEGRYSWNGAEVTEAQYNSALDAMVPPAKAKHAHDDFLTYEELLALLYELESLDGPEADIPETPFTDVTPDAFFYDAVLWAAENGITTGKTPDTFAPDLDCKRTEVVTFLWRAEGQPVPALPLDQSPLTDVEPDVFYTDAVLWAVEKGITNGMTATAFGIESSCTRAQVVTFLWRAAGEPAPGITDCPFSDAEPGSYYYDAVLWAVENEITNGMTKTEFGVDRNCTRAQIVTFLHRFAG